MMQSSNVLYLLVVLLINIKVSSATIHQWGYHHGVHPNKWGTIYPTCNGNQQSPIDIQTKDVEYDKSLHRFHFKKVKKVDGVKMALGNNGHAVQVDLSGRHLKVSGGSLPDPGVYTIEQFHFHWGSENNRGSEHEVNGRHFPMEMHVVMHSNNFKNVKEAMQTTNGLAVLGFLIDIGSRNKHFDVFINHLQKIQHKDDRVPINSFFLTNMFPKSTLHYYRYYGSLTTPPCYESVVWTIFKEHIHISQEQLNEFRHLGKTHFVGTGDLINNYRNPQPLNDRKVRTNVEYAKKSDDNDKCSDCDDDLINF